MSPTVYVLNGSNQLSSGRACILQKPYVPGLQHYYVLSVPENGTPPLAEELAELTLLAHEAGRALAREYLGDPGCYSLIYNAERTRRRPWPHFHILLAASTFEKRLSFTLLQLKHVLRRLAALRPAPNAQSAW